ncbi:lipopolysaccharide biosynthesis protein [Vibrio renipiscarius]|uniref:lipopolysaccharide biosynthesis protein n=1 Tax=Vibrio renipiscarius TaxID=1461322 RepID=UPI00354CAC62
MSAESIKKSFKWSAVERILTQAIQLIVIVALARILGPEAFGLIGMITIFIAISQTLTDSGFSSALIRKLDVNEADYATVFYFNIAISVCCYGCIFLLAPYIASYLEKEILIELIRYTGVTVLLNGLVIIQKVQLTRGMDFKTLSKVSVISVCIGGGGAIIVALLDYGVWALVVNSILTSIVSTLLLFSALRWYPKFGFSFKIFKPLFDFSSKLLTASLLDVFFENIYQLLIGKYYSAISLGYFTQAKLLSYLPTNTFSMIVQRVTYPYLSRQQNSIDDLRESFKNILESVSFVFFPLMSILCFSSEPLVTIVLGETWTAASEILSVLCCCYIFYPVHSINLNLLNVLGRSDLFLKLEVIKKIIITIVLVFSVNNGVIAMCYGLVVYSIVSNFVNAYYTHRFIGVKLREQVSISGPILLISISSAALGYLSSYHIQNDFLKFFVIVTSSVVLFALINMMFNKVAARRMWLRIVTSRV